MALRPLVSLLALGALGAGSGPLQDPAPAPAAAKPLATERAMHGFRVLVRPGFAESPLHDATMAELEHQLYQIVRAVPDAPLADLRKIPIWVGDEAEIHRTKCMFFHPSAIWLRLNEPGREFLAGGVEIANAKNFLSWTRDQPWMVLHELAHGYHHLVLGVAHAGVEAAFTAAKDSKAYQKTLHFSGREVKHYALTNGKEWFAEATEAYFGTNDFYPFVRAELRQADPAGHAELVRIWGEPRRG